MNINECGCRPYGWLGLDGNRCIRVIPRQVFSEELADKLKSLKEFKKKRKKTRHRKKEKENKFLPSATEIQNLSLHTFLP